jgi:hypothetical protein
MWSDNVMNDRKEERMGVEEVRFTRRDFLRGVAAGTAGVAALESVATSAAVAHAGETRSAYDVQGQYTTHRRNQYPEAVRATTPEEFIAAAGDGIIDGGGGVDALGIAPADFMLNVPAWLGEAPIFDGVVDEKSCDVLVIGMGTAGTTCALRLAVEGAKTIVAESQTENEYDNYVCDMTCYNNRLFKEKGVEVDAMKVFEQYMRDYGGHVNQKLVMDFATRGGEAFDFFLEYVPAEYIQKYAHPNNYSGHANYPGVCNGNYSFQGMTNWRDPETNLNMFPFVIRSVQDAFVENGGEIRWGYQGLVLVQGEDGTVTGAVFQDIDGVRHQINAKAVVVATGGYGGNPDMRLDLSDSLRNLAWNHGLDRTVTDNTFSMGRDGSGIRMVMWAGGVFQANRTAGNINSVPGFPFGGMWAAFGGDGKRFMNEHLFNATNGSLDCLPNNWIIANVTDANWETYLTYQGYGHENMNLDDETVLAEVRDEMNAYVTGPDGFDVRYPAHYGFEYETVYAAETLEELADIIGYDEDAKAGFIAEVAHWNEMCAAGKDEDWGVDACRLFPIDTPPYYARFVTTGGIPSGGLEQCDGVCTDNFYRAIDGNREAIPGLYVAGNACGQRHGCNNTQVTAGNTCGGALTSAYICAEVVLGDINA